jgi:hypothetical protein
MQNKKEKMQGKKELYKGGAKIMLSYDYCHFEITLASDEEKTLSEINEMRKEAQRLADEAVRQYKKAKQMANLRVNRMVEREGLIKEVEKIRMIPESEWTAEQKAKVKALEDYEYWSAYDYDYEDDYEDDCAF